MRAWSKVYRARSHPSDRLGKPRYLLCHLTVPSFVYLTSQSQQCCCKLAGTVALGRPWRWMCWHCPRRSASAAIGLCAARSLQTARCTGAYSQRLHCILDSHLEAHPRLKRLLAWSCWGKAGSPVHLFRYLWKSCRELICDECRHLGTGVLIAEGKQCRRLPFPNPALPEEADQSARVSMALPLLVAPSDALPQVIHCND